MSEIFSIFFNNRSQSFSKYSKANQALLFFKDYTHDLLSGKKAESSVNCIKDFLKKFDFGKDSGETEVFHLYYELGYIFTGLEQLIDAQEPLLLYISYQHEEEYQLASRLRPPNLKLVEFPQVENYRTSFRRAMEHLLDGDCYQLNLTYPFHFAFDSSQDFESLLANVFHDKSKLGAYAHATYVDCLNWGIVSNSPECLFQSRVENQNIRLWSLPIKGTIELTDKKYWKEKWKELAGDAKNESELFIIVDLLRNDLSKIDGTYSKVIWPKRPLLVPGLLHQFSLIEVVVGTATTFLSLMQALFPGGSISGAPKNRVLELLKSLEIGPRGIYCGSTVLHKAGRTCASINIRTAEVNFSQQILRYGAGGGITLKSQWNDEYLEMLAKVSSFFQLLPSCEICMKNVYEKLEKVRY